MQETPAEYLVRVFRNCGRFIAQGRITGQEFIWRTFDELAHIDRVYTEVIPDLWEPIPADFRPDFDFSIHPTRALPVNVSSVNRSSVASRSATSGTMCRKLAAPAGTPAASRISARIRLVSGACIGGFSTIVSYLVLIAVLFVRPTGLFGHTEVARV